MVTGNILLQSVFFSCGGDGRGAPGCVWDAGSQGFGMTLLYQSEWVLRRGFLVISPPSCDTLPASLAWGSAAGAPLPSLAQGTAVLSSGSEILNGSPAAPLILVKSAVETGYHLHPSQLYSSFPSD